jgi:aldehyde dehydrogenase (NAD+)
MGAYHGKAGFDAFSHRKSVLRKPTRPDLKLLYPPYKPLVERLIRKVIR